MLKIAKLSHSYPNGTRALDAVSLEVPRGVYGLLGPNGAGKSTLMRCIATLQIPTEGSLHFGPLDVLAQPAELRRRLGYLPQDFGVYPHVSAYDLLEHLALLKGVTGRAERRETVERLLVQVNLWDVRRKAVAGFSGGMRQRFGIGQALIGNPELLIVDEPTAGLDPAERNRFNDLLSEVGENVVVILSTHIVDDVSDLCGRMAIIAGGRIVAEGVPQELVRGLEGRIFRRVVDKAELAAFREQHRVISTRLRAGRTFAHVVAERSPGADFEAVAPALEDVYFSTLRAQAPGSAPDAE